jgi:predicted nucleic acid-binding protein
LFIQAKILAGEIELAWSYILDFENSANPFPERRWSIAQWKAVAVVDVFESRGLRGKDALHIACALETGCECFLTTDDQVIKVMGNFGSITVTNPTTFVTTMEQYK